MNKNTFTKQIADLMREHSCSSRFEYPGASGHLSLAHKTEILSHVFVEKGSVIVCYGRKDCEIFQEGDIIYDIHSYQDVYLVKETTLCSIDAKRYVDCITKHNLLLAEREYLLSHLDTCRKRHILRSFSSSDRIKLFLLDQFLRYGKRVGFEILWRNHFTQKDIGAIVQTSRQTVTTTLRKLVSTGILKQSRSRILLNDLEKFLSQMSHLDIDDQIRTCVATWPELTPGYARK